MSLLPLLNPALGAVLALAPQADETPAADASLVLRRADEAFCDDTSRDGLDGWMSWFDEEALVLDPFGQLWRGHKTLREHYERMRWPAPGLRWEPTGSALSTDGDLGYTVGRWHIGEAAEGSYLTVWRKDSEGQWRVVMDQGGDPAHRAKLAGPAPPRSLTFEDLQQVASESGDLRASLGRWVASADEAEGKGTYLTVWRAAQDGGWEIAASIGAPLP